MPEFHVGDRVSVISGKVGKYEGPAIFSVTGIMRAEEGLLYRGANTIWHPASALDYAPTQSHIERLESIHHQLSGLLEEGRCIAEAEWDGEHPKEIRQLLEDIDLLARVFRVMAQVK